MSGENKSTYFFNVEKIAQLESERDALQQRVAELEQVRDGLTEFYAGAVMDAKRYRWLRSQNGGKPIYLVAENFGNSLDAAIDHEMSPAADGEKA